MSYIMHAYAHIGREFVSVKGYTPQGWHELVGPSSSRPDRDQKPAGWCARREGTSLPLKSYGKHTSLRRLIVMLLQGKECLSCWFSFQSTLRSPGLGRRGRSSCTSALLCWLLEFASPAGCPTFLAAEPYAPSPWVAEATCHASRESWALAACWLFLG